MTKPQHEKRPQHEHNPWSTRWTAGGATRWLVSAALCSALFSGCVSVEKYKAEKTRALNFQRLLAQEENRADEINTQLQEAQIKMDSLGSQKDEMALQLDVLQQQVNHQPTRVPSGSAPAMSDSVGEADSMFFSETSLSELGLPDLSFEESAFQDFDGESSGTPFYHTVVKGETLYRLSRSYGVTIAQLKKWNNLTDNIIAIEQRLIVSTP